MIHSGGRLRSRTKRRILDETGVVAKHVMKLTEAQTRLLLALQLHFRGTTTISLIHDKDAERRRRGRVATDNGRIEVKRGRSLVCDGLRLVDCGDAITR